MAPPTTRACCEANIPAPSGIHFICLNANIARQFEFIQNAWIVNARFNGMDGETDPLLGNRLPFPGTQPTDTFSLPQLFGPNRRISRASAVRHRPRRRLFLSSEFPGVALPRRAVMCLDIADAGLGTITSAHCSCH